MTIQAIQIDQQSLRLVRNILSGTKLAQDYEFTVFGSRARHTASKFSDIDIAVSGQKPAPLSDIATLNENFEMSKLPYKVDIVDLSRVSDAVREEVAAYGQKVSV